MVQTGHYLQHLPRVEELEQIVQTGSVSICHILKQVRNKICSLNCTGIGFVCSMHTL